MQNRGQRAGKLRVAYRRRGDGIDGAPQRILLEYVAYRTAEILQGYPAHILAAAADLSARTHAKRSQHFLQRATTRA